MNSLGRVLHTLSPLALLRLYMAVVLVAAGVGAVVVILTASRIEKFSGQSTSEANAALIGAEVRTTLGGQIGVLGGYRNRFFSSPDFAALPAEQKAAVARESNRDYFSDVGPAETGLPHVPMPLSPKDAADLQSASDAGFRTANEVLAQSTRVDADALAVARDRYRAALDSFYADPNLVTQRILVARDRMLITAFEEASAAAVGGFNSSQDSLQAATGSLRTTIVIALVLFTATIGLATHSIGRMIQYAFIAAHAEKERLRVATDELQYRNSQLNALYNVFAEITETLSLRYVVAAALRETLNLMRADTAVIYLLKDGELTLGGTHTRNGEDGWARAPETIELGDGLVGRTAKRGRTLRIDETNENLLPDALIANKVRSGIMVPLIVGARVNGILGCWSRQPNAFGAEDERILEMMASQVATAVAAADTTETSERRAHRDPLTGLPNRLQMSDDIGGGLTALADEGGRAVVAVVDIDHFKRLNDDFSHRVGDVTLQKVASLLRHAVRDDDRVYRYGGEEFVIIFMNAGAEEALFLADRVRCVVESTPFSGEHLEPVGPVTVSIGLAVMPDHASDLSRLIDLADRAMYQAKEAGRNRVVVWREGEEEPPGRRPGLVA